MGFFRALGLALIMVCSVHGQANGEGILLMLGLRYVVVVGVRLDSYEALLPVLCLFEVDVDAAWQVSSC